MTVTGHGYNVPCFLTHDSDQSMYVLNTDIQFQSKSLILTRVKIGPLLQYTSKSTQVVVGV